MLMYCDLWLKGSKIEFQPGLLLANLLYLALGSLAKLVFGQFYNSRIEVLALVMKENLRRLRENLERKI